jgi:NTE family protein
MEESSALNSRSSSNPERLLVVSGGGSRGAWGAGYANYLVKTHGKPYRYVIGTSTGSLMAPLIVLNDFVSLKQAYTTVTQKDLFNVNPFKPNGDLKTLNAIWRLITHKKTFGESNNMRNWISTFLTEERYQEIVTANPGRQITVCCLNFNTGEDVFQSSGKEMDRETMISWIWASANEPLFSTFVTKPWLAGGNYVDGGVRDTVPVVRALKYATDLGITDIDIIVNKPKDPITNKNFEPEDSIMGNLGRVIEIWKTKISLDNIKIAELLDKLGRVELHLSENSFDPNDDGPLNLTFHYMPQKLFEENANESVFDKRKMEDMWEKGERGDEDPPHPITISKNKFKFIWGTPELSQK